jgi:ammonia channel protein AmtB
LLDYNWKIDDVVCGIPIHFFNGIWAMIATGLFSTPDAMMEAYGTDKYVGLFYEFTRGKDNMNGVLFTNQLLGICIIIVWITITTTPLFVIINYMGWFRSDNLEEVVGLDLRYHHDTDGDSNNGTKRESFIKLNRQSSQKRLTKINNNNNNDNSNMDGEEDEFLLDEK